MSEFYSYNKRKANGEEYIYYQPYCKKCAIKKSEQRIASQNKVEYAKSMAKYWKVLDQKPERIQKRKEIMQNRVKNGDQKEWQRENKDKVKGYNEKYNEKKHRISKRQWISCKAYFNNSCAYCGMTEEEHRSAYKQDLHKEHVDHEGKNDLSNCVPSCKNCNSSKNIKSLNDWFSEESVHCDSYTEERLHKIIAWLKEYIDYL